MAHEIQQDAVTGEFMFAFKGPEAWHQRETQREAMPMTATNVEVTNSAGFDKPITRAMVRYPLTSADSNAPTEYATMADRHVLIDPHSRKGFAIVSDTFQIHQPADQARLADMIAKRIDGYVDSAGKIFNGAGTFINIRAGSALQVVGRDVLTSNLLIAGMNDGSMNTIAKGSETRVICKNTRNIALASAAHARDFRLSHRTEFDADKLIQYWSLALSRHAEQVEQYKLLADTACRVSDAESIIFDLFNAKRDDDKKQDKAATVADGKRDIRNTAGYLSILGLFSGAGQGAMLPGVKGTAWGLLNAVTEYVDHHVTAKTESHRWQSATFGTGEEMKDDAFASLFAFATDNA